MFGIDLFIIKNFILSLFESKEEQKNDVMSLDYSNNLIDFSLLGEGFVLSEDKEYLLTNGTFNISGMFVKHYSTVKNKCINLFKRYGNGWRLIKSFPLKSGYSAYNAKSFFTIDNDILIIQQHNDNKFLFYIERYKIDNNEYRLTNVGEVNLYQGYGNFDDEQIFIDSITKQITIYFNNFREDKNLLFKISYLNDIKVVNIINLEIKGDYYKYLSDANKLNSRFNYVPINSPYKYLSNKPDGLKLCFYDMVENKFIYFEIKDDSIKLKNNSYVKRVELILHSGLLFIIHEAFRDEYLSIFKIIESSVSTDEIQYLNLLQEIDLTHEVNKLSKKEKINFFFDWMSSCSILVDIKYSNDFEYIQISYLTKPGTKYGFGCNRLILKKNKFNRYETTGVILKDNDNEIILKPYSDKILHMLCNSMRKTSFYFPDIKTNELVEFSKIKRKLIMENNNSVDSYVETLNNQIVVIRNNCVVITNAISRET